MRYVRVTVCVPCTIGSWWGHTVVREPVNIEGWCRLMAGIRDAIGRKRQDLRVLPEGDWSCYMESETLADAVSLAEWAKAAFHSVSGMTLWRWEWTPDNSSRIVADSTEEGVRYAA